MTMKVMARVAGAAALWGTMSIAGLMAQTSPPGQGQPPSAPQQSSLKPGGQACVPATDPEYGLTAKKAVQIGGGALYMAARERRFLDSLKGPGGETLTHRRLGSTAAEPNSSPIDMWEVTWEGAAKPVTLYLFAYLYGEPKVPAGFTCSGFTLGNPPIDGFISREQRAIVAVTQGATRDFAPISFDADGLAKGGIAFDHFRMVARASRAATASGTPLDPMKLPAALARQGLVLVAYPKKCGEKTAVPTSIEIASTTNGLMRSSQPYLSGPALSALLPGVMVPEGSIGATMPIDTLRPNDAIRVLYDFAVCEGPSRGEIFPARLSGAKGMVMPEPTRPDGVEPPPEPVWLQAVVDLDGRLLNAQHVGGPGGIFVERARETLRDWRAEPARINGSPVVADTHVVFSFKDK